MAVGKGGLMEIKKIAEAVGEYLMPQLKEISSRLDKLEVRQEEMSKRMDDLHKTVDFRINDLNKRLDDLVQGQQILHSRLDSLYQAMVRREEYIHLEARLRRVEEKLAV